MRGLHDTISRLKAMQQRPHIGKAVDSHLMPLANFGSNPGQLSAWTYIPEDLPLGAPLVVVLHGCTQSAAAYDYGSGWSAAADEHGFAVLFPEQQRANNPNLCFNWFRPQDSSRERGEALSIRQMIAAMQDRHGTDPGRVFITGLSAGGAMTAVMLATYPEVFAGGAVIAGLPFGTAQSIPEAFDRMRRHEGGHASLAQLVRSASSHSGEWPILSVWHGTADATVDSSNAEALVDQWRTLHGLPVAPSKSETIDGYPHRVWLNAEGREVVEQYVVLGMGHGTPLSTSAQSEEHSGAYMLDVGISSTQQALRFWNLSSERRNAARPPLRGAKREAPPPLAATATAKRLPKTNQRPASGVQKVIEDALRKAGLLDRYG